MATKAKINFYDEKNRLVVSVTHHYDGYIDFAGHRLATFLINSKHNGMSCLAAQYISANKKGWGNLYVNDTVDIRSNVYDVFIRDAEYIIKLDDKFEGTPYDLLNFTDDYYEGNWEFNSLNNLGVTLRHNGFKGGDSGHGGFVTIILEDLGSTCMELNGKECDKIEITFRGDSERETLVKALEHIVCVLCNKSDSADVDFLKGLV